MERACQPLPKPLPLQLLCTRSHATLDVGRARLLALALRLLMSVGHLLMLDELVETEVSGSGVKVSCVKVKIKIKISSKLRVVKVTGSGVKVSCVKVLGPT